MEGMAKIFGVVITAGLKEVIGLPQSSGPFSLLSSLGYYMRPAQEGGHLEQLPTTGLVEAEVVTMTTHHHPTNTVHLLRPKQPHREPQEQLLHRRSEVGDQAFGQELWEVRRPATWQALEDKISVQGISQHGTSMGKMAMLMGRGLQDLPGLELEEQDQAKVLVRFRAMVPVGMRVRALEVRVGDNESEDFFRFLPLVHGLSFKIAQIGAKSS